MFDFLGAGVNPFQEAMMALTAAQKPDAVSSALAQAGIAPPSGGLMEAGKGLASFLSPMQEGTGEQSKQVPGASFLQALQGFKGSQADNKPIMNAGVSGSQGAPVIGASAGQNSQLFQQLLSQLMTARGTGPQSLGQLIGG